MRTERSAIQRAWLVTFAHVARLVGVVVTAPDPSSLNLVAPVPLPPTSSPYKTSRPTASSAVAVPPGLPVDQVAAGGEGAGVAGSQDPQPVVEQVAELVGGPGRAGPPGRAQHVGEIAAGGEGVGVVGAQDSQLVVEDKGPGQPGR